MAQFLKFAMLEDVILGIFFFDLKRIKPTHSPDEERKTQCGNFTGTVELF